nr:hypothetical protein [Nocardia coffeae]
MDPSFVGECRDARGRPPGQVVICRDHESQFVAHQVLVFTGTGQIRPVARGFGSVKVIDERQVGLTVTDRCEGIVGLGFDHRDVSRLVSVGGQICQSGRKQHLTSAGKGDNGQGRRSFGAKLGQSSFDSPHFGGHGDGTFEQDVACGRQSHATSTSFDQLHTDRPFQRGDLLRYRRWSVMQSCGGTREGAG